MGESLRADRITLDARPNHCRDPVSDPAPLLARTGASPGKREIVLMSIARAGDLGQRIACSAPLESPGPLIPESLGIGPNFTQNSARREARRHR